MQGDAVLVTVLLVPAVIYLVVSGRLEELKGPGGLELRLVRIARETVTPADQTIAPTVDTMAVVQKMGLSDLQQVLRNIDEAKPTVMRMTLGGAPSSGVYLPYHPDALLAYLDALAQVRNFKLVVLVDEHGEFVACMAHWTLRGILNDRALGREFVGAINEDDRDRVLRYPGTITSAITSATTNAEALREMERYSLESLLVVDDGTPKGVVERERILTNMLLTLSAA